MYSPTNPPTLFPPLKLQRRTNEFSMLVFTAFPIKPPTISFSLSIVELYKPIFFICASSA